MRLGRAKYVFCRDVTDPSFMPHAPHNQESVALGALVHINDSNWKLVVRMGILGQIHRYECLMTTTPAEVLDTRQLSRGFDTQTVAETATIESSIRRFATEVARLHAQLLDDASQCP